MEYLKIFRDSGEFKMIYSRLEKYKRPEFGALTKQYNTKLPEGLSKELEVICKELNMSPPEFIRLLIYEEVSALRAKKIPRDTKKYPLISSDTKEYPAIPEKPPSRKNISTTSSKNKGKGQARSIQQWTIDNLVPCPLCDPPRWITRTNYARHVKKHGFNNGYELIQANLDKVEKMVLDKSEQ